MIDPTSLSEKQRIEYATATAFLHHYNEMRDKHFKVVKLGDFPDVHCKDTLTDESLKLEVTLIEDRLGDIKYVLGRRTIPDEILLSKTIDFAADVIPRLIERLKDKLLSSYGADTALLIYQVSPLWTAADWQRNVSKIQYEIFTGKESNYGRGVWIICNSTSATPTSSDIFCLFDPNHPQPPISRISLPSLSNEVVKGKVAWETNILEDFKVFQSRNDVDPVVRIPSPHGCEYALIIAFLHDEPEVERENAIAFYQAYMNIICPCGKATAKTLGNWIKLDL